MIKEKIHAGLINDYNDDDLEIAYMIYKEIIEADIKSRIVTMDVLKLARDPDTALENIVERRDALDTDQMES